MSVQLDISKDSPVQHTHTSTTSFLCSAFCLTSSISGPTHPTSTALAISAGLQPWVAPLLCPISLLDSCLYPSPTSPFCHFSVSSHPRPHFSLFAPSLSHCLCISSSLPISCSPFSLFLQTTPPQAVGAPASSISYLLPSSPTGLPHSTCRALGPPAGWSGGSAWSPPISCPAGLQSSRM